MAVPAMRLGLFLLAASVGSVATTSVVWGDAGRDAAGGPPREVTVGGPFMRDDGAPPVVDEVAFRESIERDFCRSAREFESPCVGEQGGDPVDAASRVVSVEFRSPSAAPEASSAFDARFARLVGQVGPMTAERLYLAVRTRSETRTGVVLAHLNSGVGGVSYELGVRSFRWIDRVGGGEPELELVVESFVNDEDMGECARNGQNTTSLVLCSVDVSPLACVSLPLRRTAYDEYEGHCDGRTDPPTLRRTGYELEPRFRRSNLSLRPVRRSPGAAPGALRGGRPVRDWLLDPAFAWPAGDPSATPM